MYKDNWTQPWPMGSKIYPEVHENPRTFFSSSSPILLEPLAHGSSDWFLPRKDCIRRGICSTWVCFVEVTFGEWGIDILLNFGVTIGSWWWYFNGEFY